MEKIIQLSQNEYDKMHEMANVNQSEIERLAKEMYEKKGTFEISISIEVKDDYTRGIVFRPNAIVRDYGNSRNNYNERYEVPYEQGRKIAEYAERKMNQLFEKKFGRQIHNINLWNKRFDLLRNWRMKFIGWTIFGWLAALALVLIAIFK